MAVVSDLWLSWLGTPGPRLLLFSTILAQYKVREKPSAECIVQTEINKTEVSSGERPDAGGKVGLRSGPLSSKSLTHTKVLGRVN